MPQSLVHPPHPHPPLRGTFSRREKGKAEPRKTRNLRAFTNPQSPISNPGSTYSRFHAGVGSPNRCRTKKSYWRRCT